MFGQVKVLLIIGSNRDSIRGIVKKFLNEMGSTIVREMEIFEAENGEIGLSRILKVEPGNRPNLVICYNELEDIKGLEIMRQCRANIDTKYLPFVMITSDSSYANVADLGECGEVRVLAVPFSQQSLEQRFLELLKRSITPYLALLRKADELYQKGQSDQALKILNCISHNKRINATATGSNLAALNLKGEILSSLGKIDEAEEIFSSITQEQSSFVAAASNLARIKRDKGQLKEAQAALERADAIVPNNVDRKMELGEISFLLKEMEKGKGYFQAACRLIKDPTRKEAVAKTLGENGFPEEAAQVYTELSRSNVDDPEQMSRWAIELRRSKRYLEAERVYARIREKWPSHLATLLNLAVLFLYWGSEKNLTDEEHKDKLTSARYYVSKLLKEDPQNEEGRKLYEQYFRKKS